MDNLKKIMSMCKCGVFISVNEHRDWYQTAKEAIEEILRGDEGALELWRTPDEIQKEIIKTMISTNTIICVQAYPETPHSFHSTYHYDIDKALETMVALLEGDK